MARRVAGQHKRHQKTPSAAGQKKPRKAVRTTSVKTANSKAEAKPSTTPMDSQSSQEDDSQSQSQSARKGGARRSSKRGVQRVIVGQYADASSSDSA